MQTGIDMLQFILWCQGVEVHDCSTVGELPVPVLDVTMCVPGGKVHGSLARAGKVRAQTPKVDRSDKKKPKTGRAKRRAQYRRRFGMAIILSPTGNWQLLLLLLLLLLHKWMHFGCAWMRFETVPGGSTPSGNGNLDSVPCRKRFCLSSADGS
uniref:40S ribosomal protein S30 n=1 Tax=Anopheles farauti TaxID=69004 RepID=A0A182QMU5_9DIPT